MNHDSHPASEGSGGFSATRLLLLIIPLAAITLAVLGYLYYDAQKSTPPPLDFLVHVRRSLASSTKLSHGLTDADGDLVADAPADEKALLDPETLVFGVLGPDPVKEQERWGDFLTHLEKETGRKIELQSMEPQSEFSLGENIPVRQDRTADVREGKLHIVSMNTGAVAAYVNDGGVVPVCVMANDEGKFAYHMEIIVPAKSPIQKVSDLRGQRFTFATLTSHSGFRAPMVALWKEFDMQPERDYHPIFAGNQELILQHLGKGDAGIVATAVASDLVKRLESRGAIKPADYRSIYSSREFPPACFGYAHQLKPELAKKISEAFLNFPFAGTSLEKAYAPAGQTKFVPVSYKEHWSAVRETDEFLQSLLARGERKE